MLGVKPFFFFFLFCWQEFLWPRNVVKMMDGNHMGERETTYPLLSANKV